MSSTHDSGEFLPDVGEGVGPGVGDDVGACVGHGVGGEGVGRVVGGFICALRNDNCGAPDLDDDAARFTTRVRVATIHVKGAKCVAELG